MSGQYYSTLHQIVYQGMGVLRATDHGIPLDTGDNVAMFRIRATFVLVS